MSTGEGPKVGTICWRDLTVENAEQVLQGIIRLSLLPSHIPWRANHAKR